MGPVVALSDVTVTWPGEPGAPAAVALDGISLTVAAGEVVGLVGETGSGRSTLLRCLNGIVPQLVPADVRGTLEIAERDPRVTPVAEMAGDVAIVLDDPEAQVSQATVAEEVALGLESLGVPVAEMRIRVREVLDRVGLAGLEDRHPLTLSGGEQQRLAVACAVAVRPRLLLLDEPTANLDPRAGRRLLGLVRELAAERDMAVVIADDDAELLAEHADRIAWLDGGRIRLDDRTSRALSAIARADPTGPVPQVTALAAMLEPAGRDLPVTVEGAVAWFAGRS